MMKIPNPVATEVRKKFSELAETGKVHIAAAYHSGHVTGLRSGFCAGVLFSMVAYAAFWYFSAA